MRFPLISLFTVLLAVGSVYALEVSVNGQAVAGMFTDITSGEGSQNPTDPLTNDTTPIMGQRVRADIYFKVLFSPEYEFNVGFSADDYRQNPAWNYAITGDPSGGYVMTGINARKYVSLNVYNAALTMHKQIWGADATVGAIPLRWGGKGYYNFYRNDLDGRYYLADLDMVGVQFQNPEGFIKWNLNVGGGHYGEPIVGAKFNIANLALTFASEGLYYDLGTLWDYHYRSNLPPYGQTKMGRMKAWRTDGPWLSTGYMDTWHAGAEYAAKWGIVETACEFVYHSFKSDPFRTGASGGTVWELYPDFIFHPTQFAQLDLAGEISQWQSYRNDFWGDGISTQQAYRAFIEPAWLPNEKLLIGLGGEYVKPGNLPEDFDSPYNEKIDQHISAIPHLLYMPLDGIQWDTRIYYQMWDKSWDVVDRTIKDAYDVDINIPGTPYAENQRYIITTKAIVYF
jgi:hypothetical protein